MERILKTVMESSELKILREKSYEDSLMMAIKSYWKSMDIDGLTRNTQTLTIDKIGLIEELLVKIILEPQTNA